MTSEQERWLDENCYEPGSERVTAVPSLARLPESYGWARWLSYELEPRPVSSRSLLDDVIGAGRTRGVLLCGATGNGRHTLANAIASTLNADGWYFLQLSGSRLERDGKSAALGAMQEMFANSDEEVRICITLEDPEQCSWCAELYGLLIWQLFNSGFPGKPRLFLTLIAAEDRVPTELRNLLQICRLVCPDKDARGRYLSDAMSDPPLELDGMTPLALTEATEGFSYRKLESMVYFMRLAQRELIVKNEPVSTWPLFAEDPSKFARQHLPRKTVEQLIAMLRIAPAQSGVSAAPQQIVVQTVAGAPGAVAAVGEPGIDAANLSQEELQARYRAGLDKLSYRELKAELERNVRRVDGEGDGADDAEDDYESE